MIIFMEDNFIAFVDVHSVKIVDVWISKIDALLDFRNIQLILLKPKKAHNQDSSSKNYE